jgi:hypothetical protein
VRARSPKRAAQERVYRERARDFLYGTDRDQVRPCEFPKGCDRIAREVHHRKGRVGPLLLDERFWSALCKPCHAWVTGHPERSYELGISERRVGGAA